MFKNGVQGVVSSNPTVPTNKQKGLQFLCCKPFFYFDKNKTKITTNLMLELNRLK